MWSSSLPRGGDLSSGAKLLKRKWATEDGGEGGGGFMEEASCSLGHFRCQIQPFILDRTTQISQAELLFFRLHQPRPGTDWDADMWVLFWDPHASDSVPPLTILTGRARPIPG
jgi:hypothetical protein